MSEIKTVSLIGLGAIGSYLSVQLESILHDDFRVVASGSRKEKLDRGGILYRTEQGGEILSEEIHRFHTVTPEEETGYADLAIIITKFPALRSAIEDLRNQVGPDTILLSPLNGLEAEGIIGGAFGSKNVIYSLSRIAVDRAAEENVRIYHKSEVGRMEIGIPRDSEAAEQLAAVAELFTRAGIPFQIAEDIEFNLWHKFMCNIGSNMAGGVLHATISDFLTNEDARFIREQAMREVIALANAQGIALNEDHIRGQHERLTHVSPDHKSSTLQDILAQKPSEVEAFSGTAIRYGKKLNIPTPYNEFCYHAIRFAESKYERK